jgi:hypothetical protein
MNYKNNVPNDFLILILILEIIWIHSRLENLLKLITYWFLNLLLTNFIKYY